MVPPRAGPSFKANSSPVGVCREFFGAGGVVSSAWKDQGAEVAPPLEVFPCGLAFQADHDLRRNRVLRRELEKARRSLYRPAYFAPPAGTLGPLYRMSQRCTRGSSLPFGDGSVQREEDANVLAEATRRICEEVLRRGGDVVVELPYGSYFEKLPGWCGSAWWSWLRKVVVDLREYGLAPPEGPDERFRKRIILLSPLDLCCLERRCGGEHRHQQCRGAVRFCGRSHRRSSLASAVPPAFAHALAAATRAAAGAARPAEDSGRVNVSA